MNIHVGVSEVCSIRCRSKTWRWSRRYLLEGKEEEEKKIELDRSMDGVNSRWTENGTAGSGASPPKCLQKPKRPPLDQPQPHSRTGGEREQVKC